MQRHTNIVLATKPKLLKMTSRTPIPPGANTAKMPAPKA